MLMSAPHSPGQEKDHQGDIMAISEQHRNGVSVISPSEELLKQDNRSDSVLDPTKSSALVPIKSSPVKERLRKSKTLNIELLGLYWHEQ